MATTRSARATQFLVNSAFGAAMPALMFTALHWMTLNHGEAATPRIAAHKIEFTRLIQDTRVEFERPTRPPPPAPIDRDPVVVDTSFRCLDCVGFKERPQPIPRVIFEQRERRDPTMGHPGTDTSDPQPFVRILPEYPPNGRGDGWVLVRFNISPSGAVTNAVIVDAKPRGLFDKNALRAIGRWRYRPAVVDGRAVERRGLQVKLIFKLEKA